MNILIVDDSQMVRNYYYYILKSAGYNAVSAIDGADGLEKLYFHDNIDLIVSDINMPNTDGYTMIERIRSEERYEDLPIIIVSTESEAEDKQRGFDAGADLYMVKPIEPDVLLNNIKLLTGD